MAENTESAGYEPGVYVKGDSARVATTASAAVALVFDGYERQGDVPEGSEAASAQPKADEPVKDEPKKTAAKPKSDS